MPTEHWRVGRHVPHHIYRGDGGTIADEVAVTHRPEDAAQIVAEHQRVMALEIALADLLSDAVHHGWADLATPGVLQAARAVLADEP